MDRRSWLAWCSRALGLACATVVAVPAVRYLVDPLRRSGDSDEIRRRVARLEELEPGEPRMFAVSGSYQDAWTFHDETVLGQVWIVREDAGDASADARVTAFSATCPHKGCVIPSFDQQACEFQCPCHKASFDLFGEPIEGAASGEPNPAPRPMDSLTVEVVQDDASGTWWVEVVYQEFESGLETKEVKG